LNEAKEPELVALPHTVANPRAMMIMSCNAIPTGLAMLAAKWLFYMAYGAVLVLNVQLHFIVIII
jgi:hypothetical protein